MGVVDPLLDLSVSLQRHAEVAGQATVKVESWLLHRQLSRRPSAEAPFPPRTSVRGCWEVPEAALWVPRAEGKGSLRP